MKRLAGISNPSFGISGVSQETTSQPLQQLYSSFSKYAYTETDE